VIDQTVKFYRLHFINRATGTIGQTYEFHAKDDEAALAFAEVWASEGPMQLWSNKGCLKLWDAPQV
jgi:hypothetical protein